MLRGSTQQMPLIKLKPYINELPAKVDSLNTGTTPGVRKEMKVLRIIDSMDPKLGGPGQGVRNTIPALALLGVHCEVVSLDHPSAPFIKSDPFITHAIGP